jgi:hypothetical protein
LYYYKQRVTSPARLAGTVALVHETIDQVKEPSRAWVYNAGQRRVRRAPQASYFAAETLYDLISGRYMVVGLRNEEPRNTEYGLTAKNFEFTPAALRSDGLR